MEYYTTIQKTADIFVQKINVFFLLGVFFMFPMHCYANCSQAFRPVFCVPEGMHCYEDCPQETNSSPRVEEWAVFIWKEEEDYLFVQQPYFGSSSLFRESIVELRSNGKQDLDRKRNLSVDNLLRELEETADSIVINMIVHFIEDPLSPPFLDERHNPMRPEKEFRDIKEKLSVLAEKKGREISFFSAETGTGIIRWASGKVHATKNRLPPVPK